MASSPATTPAKTEADHRLVFKIIDALTTSFKVVCRYGCFCLCFYFAFRIVEVLAGRTTEATFALKLAVSIFGNDKLLKTILLALTGGSIAYGAAQKRLRQKDIQRLTPRPRQLEALIDPNRTSS